MNAPRSARRGFARPGTLLLPLAGGLLLAAILVGGLLLADWSFPSLPAQIDPVYVGRESCAECHAEQSARWTGSDHDLAMDHATSQTVLGDFNDARLEHFGVVSRMFRRGEAFFIETDGPDGRPTTYPIKFVFGVRPLQQYLVEFPGGRLQCLAVSWDTVKNRWFHLYPDEAIPHTDELHWTRPLQNWNYMCAECHSTNLQKNYDLASNAYRTSYAEIDVSCEACHGPASDHVRLARSWRFFWDRRHGYALPTLKTPENRVQVESCAPCHARRRIVAAGHRPASPLLDYYVPELLDSDLYHADGQILSEDYEYGSFIQSRMYHQNVRCSDCHDPHSLRVKFKDAPEIRDNRLCGQCHVPAKYDGPAHHHHPRADRPGTLCIECHMPKTTYMVVDPRLDHSIRIPRPDLTVELGIPNACNGCHHDEQKGETPQWAAATVAGWYGEKRRPRHFAHALAAGRQHKPEAVAALDAVCRRKDESAMVRASAIALLGNYGATAALASASEGLNDADGLVRYSAVRALQTLPPDEIATRLLPSLRDPLRAVRVEAARALSVVPPERLASADREAFWRAIDEYMAAQAAVEEQPGAHLNRAVVLANLGRTKEAESGYRTALRLDETFVPARMNLAMLFDAQGRKPEAEEQLRRVVELQPKFAEGHYSLGLLLAEDPKRLVHAAGLLATAAELSPQNARIHYNLGLAYQHLRRWDEAEAALRRAYELEPADATSLRALAILYAQQGRWERALACAEQVAKMSPGDADAAALVDDIRRQAAAAKKP